MRCYFCGSQNSDVEDRCAQCMHTLMSRDIPHKVNDKYRNAFMTTPISDLLTGRDLLIASPTDTVEQVVKILKDEKKDCVLVYKKHQLVGILSERDFVRRVAGKYKDLSKVKVEEVMTPKPEFVKGDDPIAFAVNKMAVGGFRHVPVLREDGTPLSIITIKDVLEYLSRRAKTTSKSAA